MKKTIALLLAALVSGSSLIAQESSYSITLDMPYVSDYVFRGIKYADDSIQPSVEFASGDFYAGIWANEPLSGPETNEYDFYAGYGVALSETWAMDFGATYYYYPETPSGDEQFEPFVGATGAITGDLSGSIYYFYETEFQVSTLQVGLGYSSAISETTTFDLAADLGTVSMDGPGDYNYWSISGKFTLAVNDASGVYAGLVYADNDVAGLDNGFIYFTAGASVKF